MKKTILLLTIILNFTTVMAQNSVLDFTVKDRKGNDVALSEYKGKVLLIVNTATKCGFTPQYEELRFSIFLATSLATRLLAPRMRFTASAL